MPLDRANITSASAVMLPFYFATDVVWGIVFITDPQNRLGLAPSMEPARNSLPVWAWGCMWLGLAALMAYAWLRADRDQHVLAIGINGTTWLAWGLLIEAAVLVQPNVSFLAGWLGLTMAVASYATIRTLRAKER